MGRGRARFERSQRRENHQEKVFEAESRGPEPAPKSTITLEAPGQKPVVLKVKDFRVDVEHDYVDVTHFGSIGEVYLTSLRKYTITASE